MIVLNMKALVKTLDKLYLIRLYRYYIIDSILIVKNEGFKQLFRKRGWKFLLVIVAYYLIRDSILYLLIPFLVLKGIL